MAGSALTVENLTVTYGTTTALAEFSMQVRDGELVALLGPSGSGKSTLLHAVAGFIRPRNGCIRIRDRLVATPERVEPPERRHVGLVFQRYALWPHLNVLDTVTYPLERRGIKRAVAQKQAIELLARLGLGDLVGRRPAELSGGQQQRVGLARALISHPELFLFDEPTANLDSGLRAAFQEEIIRQRQVTGAAGVYITHDPEEAFAIADRVITVRGGRLIQDDSPARIYARPADAWVAGLTGSYSLLEGKVVRFEGHAEQRQVVLNLAGHELRCTIDCDGPADASPARVEVLLRPEWLTLDVPDSQGVPARVAIVRFQGPHTDYVLDSQVGRVVVRGAGPARHAVGDSVRWAPRRVWLFPHREDARS